MILPDCKAYFTLYFTGAILRSYPIDKQIFREKSIKRVSSP